MIDNVYRQLERKIDVLERLVKVSLAMNSTLHINTLLDYLMDAATEITGSEAASILVLDKNTGLLRFAAATGPVAPALIGLTVPVEDSLAGAVLQEEQAINVPNARSDRRHYPHFDQQFQFETRTLLGVPLYIRSSTVGVLEVLNRRDGPFTDEDVQHLTILASQAAVAIENAGLIRSLEEAYQSLNQLNKLKTDFISIASHELRTPLSLILGYATLLKEDIDGEATPYADALLSSVNKMCAVVDGMTNLGYVQLDESEMTLAPTDLERVLQAAYSDMHPKAEAKSQALVLEQLPQSVAVQADFPKLVMALTNVLDNAIKFTPEGGAIVLAAEPRGREAWVSVLDNGCGIPGDQLERVFDLFYQVEDPLTRHNSGLGLGLTIARAVVERHGGRIWAESPGVGQGSRFTIALPLANNPNGRR